MARLRLEEADLIVKKNPRMPVCILVETSDVVMEDAGRIRNVQKGIDRLSENIRESLSLKALTDVCLISFGSVPKITRKFGTLKEDERIEPEIMGGRADLEAALCLLIKEYRIRLNDYEANRVKRYTPVFFILAADQVLTEEGAGMSQVSHWSRTGKASVIPVALNSGPGNTLEALSVDGTVYEMNSMNYEKIFETLGKSIEMLSRSSSGAVENLKLKSIEWDQFKRR